MGQPKSSSRTFWDEVHKDSQTDGDRIFQDKAMLLANSLFEAGDIAHNAVQDVGTHIMWGETTPSKALLGCLEGMVHNVVKIINEKDSSRQISVRGGKFQEHHNRAVALVREKNIDSVNAFLPDVQEHEEQGREVVYG